MTTWNEGEIPSLLLLLPLLVVDDESDNGGGSGDDGDHDNFLDRCIPSFLLSSASTSVRYL